MGSDRIVNRRSDLSKYLIDSLAGIFPEIMFCPGYFIKSSMYLCEVVFGDEDLGELLYIIRSEGHMM